MKNHLINDLKMHLPTGDLAYFTKNVHGKLSGMVGTYVGDLIAVGDDKFMEQSRLTGQLFTKKNREFDSFVIAGIHIKKECNKYMLNQ